MSDALEITGHIRKASFERASGELFVRGEICGDARKRFPDGEIVTTSPVSGFDNDKRVVITRNSAYTVSPWRPLARCECCGEVMLFTGHDDPHYAEAAKALLIQDDGLGFSDNPAPSNDGDIGE